MTVVDFALPPELEASAPPRRRDDARLLVVHADRSEHAQFADLARYLEPGDLLVVNTSRTLAAAVDGRRGDTLVAVHFSAELDDGSWVVEVRPAAAAGGPVPDLRTGEVIELDDGIALTIGRPHPDGQRRLWRAELAVDGGVLRFLARHGRPIRYAYVPVPYPLEAYQTIFADEPGSAEMPSAGRPFTPQLVIDLVVRGVAIAPITLHTGVSSQEPGEPPQPERFRVPAATARLANHVSDDGGRVVAVGTTVTRALETAADGRGRVYPRSGWTDLVLGASRRARVVTGLVTGWHAPGASHLELLRAVADDDLVERAYADALRARYRWHEFGDSALLLPSR